MTTNYTLDLASGLTQVLSDGTNTYLYGNMRLAQQDATTTEYFLIDALGSVRQLVDETGTLTLAQAYQPLPFAQGRLYGETLTSASNGGASSYAFAGEMTDPTGLQYLRARYYAPWQGRFMTKDAWAGDALRPMSFNPWLYVYANPVNFTDPTGLIPKCNADPRSSGFSHFSYSIDCQSTPKKLLVNFYLNPWKRFINPLYAPPGIVQIPLRKPLNLIEEFGLCSSIVDIDTLKKSF